MRLMLSNQTCNFSFTITKMRRGQILGFYIRKSLFYIYTPLPLVQDYLIGFSEIFVVFCGVLPLNRFFLFPSPLQKRMKKDRVCVGGWGVLEQYREIDEAVRAGVITRCPFPKPDWQTANITQTPGPDRHTTTPPPPAQTGETEHPNLQPRPNGVWAS